MEWLREAHRRTRKDGALGIDGQRAGAYAVELDENLHSLLDRAKSGMYRAPPVRRVNIPKGNGETRPLGIPTFEDKVLQRAVAMVLGAVYEQDFLDCSYGFRPKRSAHQALDALQDAATRMYGGWVIELDIRKYFDSIDHERLREVLDGRVRDGVIRRLIGKWLNAGVMEAGELRSSSEAGTPQGGVISPLLANIFLHEVLDVWFDQQVKPRLRGRAMLVRYADDAVVLFQYEDDAKRVMEVLPKRFGKYGLALHPEKTRLVPFRALRRGDRPVRRFVALSLALGTLAASACARKLSSDDCDHLLGRGIGLASNGPTRSDPAAATTATTRPRGRSPSTSSASPSIGANTPLADGRCEKDRPRTASDAGFGASRSGVATIGMRHFRCNRKSSRRRSQLGLTWEVMNEILQRHPLPQPGQTSRT